MSNDEFLTDDYVAGLLIEESKDCSLKYSAMGMDAMISGKKPENMPKPNTRFLRNVIKNTNAHNKALLAKEATQSHARFKNLEYTDEIKRRKLNLKTGDVRKRQLGQIHAIIGDRRGTSDRVSNRDEHWKHQRPNDKNIELTTGETQQSRRYDRLSHEEIVTKDCKRRQEEIAQLKRSQRHASEADDAAFESRRLRTASPRISRKSRRSRSPNEECSKSRRRSRHHSRNRSQHRPTWSDQSTSSAKASATKVDSDFDPLEDFIGPVAPPKHRGRGRIGGALDLDRRFSASYDPKADIEDIVNIGEDWDDTVEAFRDRQKLRVCQEQRMRNAGFAEDQIEKMKGGWCMESRTEPDVIWSKAGEVRAWDNGKILDEEMEVERAPTLFSER
ncbi:hypothetical protein CDD81_1049 [Ophiocordyceps australis]|uniref:Pre-mRNA-splicing factor 38B n=1 Tax=Ophiocordyceps australis TaxID=1399860 RepID=A0A2C5XFN0_9HYPO|nr:hypothetical protein CDD81_1049 [Ophiocordyceps australis]